MSDDLPPRLTTPEVLSLARYRHSTLRARKRAGLMPQPVDRGADGWIYDRDAVLKALGLAQDDKQPERDPWDFDDRAFDQAFSRPLRRAEKARQRAGPGLLSGAVTPASIRLVAGDTAPR